MVRGQWPYLYQAIDKHGTSVDFLLTAKRDLDAAKRTAAGERLRDNPAAARAAGIKTRIGNHTFRATGITAYLKTAARSKRRR